MAHVGKLYPVAFRRDYNLDVGNNRVGFARGYSFGTENIFGLIGQHMPGRIWNLIAVNETTEPGIKWESDPQSIEGYDVHVEMSTMDDAATFGIKTLLKIIASGVGDLANMRAAPPGGLGYAQVNGGYGSGPFPHPDLFLPTFSATWSASALRWSFW